MFEENGAMRMYINGSQVAEGAADNKMNAVPKQGFDLELNRAVSRAVQVPIIASGGVGNLQHLVEGVLEGEADAVLAASIFHFQEYSIQEAKQFMQEAGIEVRL